jgi:hypothetical protein
MRKYAARFPVRTISVIDEWGYAVAVILFPIAFVWMIVLLVYLIRNSKNEPEAPEGDPPPRRFKPRPPRRGPRVSGSRSRARTGAGASRRRD